MEILKKIKPLAHSGISEQLTLQRLFQLLLLACILSCLTLFLTLALHASHNARQQAQWLNDYGQGMARLVRSQLAVAVNDNNLISLQSQLNQLLQQQRVFSAVVYDVNNRIIVQAGTATPLHSRATDHHTITTPVTLDSSVLGSLTLTLVTDNNRPSAIVGMLGAISFALLLVSLGIAFYWRRLQSDTEANATAATAPPLTSEKLPLATTDAVVIKPESLHSIALALHLGTWGSLTKQLNAEARQHQLLQLQEQIDKVLTLYSGNQCALTPETIVLSFSDGDSDTALTNALCSAYLLSANNDKRAALLRFNCFIYDPDTHGDSLTGMASLQQLVKSPASVEDKRATTFVQQALAKKHSLGQRVSYQSDNDNSGYVAVERFSERYEQLLQRQLKHL